MLEKLYNNKRLLLGFALLCYIFIALICIANGEMGPDEGIWSYMGRIWVENDMPPYVKAVENKTPGIFYIYAFSHYLFGTNFFFPRLLGIASILFNAFILYKIGISIADKLSGRIAGILFAFSMLWTSFYSPHLSATEVFMVLFTSMGYLVLFNHRKPNINISTFLLSGLLLGFAINFKQIAVTGLLGILVYIIIKKDLKTSRKALNIGAVIAGTFLSLIVGYVPLIFNGISPYEYIKGAWLILSNEGSSFTSSTYLWRVPRFIQTFFYNKIALYYPVLILGLIYRKTLFNSICRFELLILWLIFSFIGANTSGYYFDHHLIQMAPSLSLLIGIILAKFSKITYGNLLIPGLIGFIMILPHKPFVKNMSTILDRSYRHDTSIMTSFKNHLTGFSDKKELGLWLRKRTNKDDFIFARVLPIPLSYSNRKAPTKYFNSMLITTPELEKKVLIKLREKIPKFIIEYEKFNKLKKIDNFKKNNYNKVKTFKGKFRIYKLK